MQLRQRRKPIRCPEHLGWIRRQPCSVLDCRNQSVPHHVRNGGDGGMGVKPSDSWAVPICQVHHSELHRIGHRSFEKKHGLDLRAIALTFAAGSPYLPTD